LLTPLTLNVIVVTVFFKDNPMTHNESYTPQQLQAYSALRKAAERMGANGYAAEMARRKMTPGQAADWVRRNKRSLYIPTGEHCAVIEAMGKVLSGEMDPEEAMNLLQQYDVQKQRLGER
jgi:hypothetical protein